MLQNDVDILKKDENSPINIPSDDTPLLLGKKAGSIQQPEDEELVEKKFLWLVKLSPSSTHVNFATFLFGVFITMIILPFSSAFLPFVLSTYLHIPAEEQGRTIGDLVFYNGIIMLLFANMWGTLSDLVGRRIIFGASFIFIGISMILIPLATSFWMLVGFRVIMGIGCSGATSMLSPCLADLCSRSHMGKAGAFVGITATLGGMVGSLVFLQLPQIYGSLFNLTLKQAGYATFGTAAILSFILPLVLFFGLKHTKNNGKKTTITKIVKDGLKAMKNPYILFCYILGFVARANTSLIASFIPLWITQQTLKNGGSEADAMQRVAFITGTSNVASFIGTPIFGFLLDKAYPMVIVTFTSFAVACGYLGMGMLNDVTGYLMLGCTIVAGTGQIGSALVSQNLLTTNAPPAVRGSVGGFHSFIASSGVLIATKAGGYAYDHLFPGSIFIIAGLLNFLVIMIGWFMEIGIKVKDIVSIKSEIGNTKQEKEQSV
jgi:MFS family permease